MDWRRSQNKRKKHSLSTASSGGEDPLIRDENQRVRAAAWAAYYQVKLLCDDVEIEDLARQALESVDQMKDAVTREDVQDSGERLRAQLDDFLAKASGQTRATT